MKKKIISMILSTLLAVSMSTSVFAQEASAIAEIPAIEEIVVVEEVAIDINEDLVEEICFEEVGDEVEGIELELLDLEDKEEMTLEQYTSEEYDPSENDLEKQIVFIEPEETQCAEECDEELILEDGVCESSYELVSENRGQINGSDVVRIAEAQLGKAYVWGASGPNSFDCVGLVKYVYAQFGVNLPMGTSSYSSGKAQNYGVVVSRSEMLPGDIIFYGSSRDNLGHAAIYTGNGESIQAINPSHGVKKVYADGAFGNAYGWKLGLCYNGTIQFALRPYAVSGTSTQWNPFSAKSASKIGLSNAQIDACFSSTQYCSEVGFSIGTDVNNRRQFKETVNGNVLSMWYDLNKWYGQLQAGTTYYYEFYAVIGGKTYCSGVDKFTTQVPPQIIESAWVENITETEAVIHGQLNGMYPVTSCGAYVGTSKDSMKKIGDYGVTGSTKYFWFSMNKYYGQLKAGTKYYYKMWAVKDGYEFQSAVYEFTTKGTAATNKVNTTPTPTIAPTATPAKVSTVVTTPTPSTSVTVASTAPQEDVQTAGSNENSTITSAAAAATGIAVVSVKAGEWKKDSKGWWYRYNDGSYPKNTWVTINGAKYHFDRSGYMQTGWIKDGGNWYYLRSSGAMATGWIKDGGKWYYLRSNGTMATGWIKDGGKWYYLRSSGAMATGWIVSGGKDYYLYGDGHMASNEWIGRYHVNNNGVWDKTK